MTENGEIILIKRAGKFEETTFFSHFFITSCSSFFFIKTVQIAGVPEEKDEILGELGLEPGKQIEDFEILMTTYNIDMVQRKPVVILCKKKNLKKTHTKP